MLATKSFVCVSSFPLEIFYQLVFFNQGIHLYLFYFLQDTSEKNENINFCNLVLNILHFPGYHQAIITVILKTLTVRSSALKNSLIPLSNRAPKCTSYSLAAIQLLFLTLLTQEKGTENVKSSLKHRFHILKEMEDLYTYNLMTILTE